MERGKGKRAVQTQELDQGPAKKLRRKLKPSMAKRPTASGNVLTCGQGEVGQLGLGEDVMEKTRPAIVDGLSDVVDISAGGMHNLCLTATGKVYSFGCNDEGALGRDTSEEGSEFVAKPIDLPGPCVKISAGDSHSACLLEDGRVFAWGSFRDSHGNMGLTLEGNKRLPIEVQPPVGLSRWVDIASGSDHLVMLSTAGNIYTVGCAEQGQLGRISIRAASGESRRGKTQLLRPDIVTLRGRAVEANAIWATTYCTFYRDPQKERIYAFGLNNYCQLGISNPSENVVKPVFVPEVTSFIDAEQIAGGQHHTLVLKTDGKVYAIGRKEYGRLGLGEVSEDVKMLTLVEKLADKKVVSINCGDSASFAVTNTGEVYAWGMGSNQQLGTGNEEDEISPVLIASKQVQGKVVLKVSSGGQHSIFLVQETPTKKPEKKEAAKAGKTNGTTSTANGEASASSSTTTASSENQKAKPETKTTAGTSRKRKI
ncbi:regulator of chromosome condensation [Anopheles aquasalis]|uniref:regulator of chromosome condensation n=1 Tax=Anopheles aquasalis TaxID=42839 RepID=UPI00215AE6A6|nr:regulator of chromosome condensation [Anopheles aquasalis]